uniref:Uncharacterized protein n=1 Tax=Octopus bimaculoides TaxID=37653 RepID=A0A0L8FLV3_OCTBM
MCALNSCQLHRSHCNLHVPPLLLSTVLSLNLHHFYKLNNATSSCIKSINLKSTKIMDIFFQLIVLYPESFLVQVLDNYIY